MKVPEATAAAASAVPVPEATVRFVGERRAFWRLVARGAVFLSTLWLLGAAWILALPLTRETLDRLRLRLPIDSVLIDRVGPMALLTVTGIVWAVAVWDAGATRRRR